MATLKVTLTDGAIVTEAEYALPDGPRFLAWISSIHADVGTTPAEYLDAWWAGTVQGTASNVLRFEETEAAQTALDTVEEMLAVPLWKAGIVVAVDERYFFDGVVYRVVQAHTTQAGWTPPIVPALFQPV